MPHPEEEQEHENAPDQWDSDLRVNADTAREVTPWTTMDGKNAPRNFRPVPIGSDEAVEVPGETVDTPTVPKDSSALESATSSQESDSPSSETETPEQPSPTQETPAPSIVVKASGQPKETGTSSQSSS